MSNVSQMGDGVAIPTGAEVLFVFRRTSTGNEFQIVEESHVHGVDEYDVDRCQALLTVRSRN